MRRQFWVAAHRYVGWTLALFLLLAGLTGSLLAFHREIDAWLNGDWHFVTPKGRRLPLDELVRRAEAHYPELAVRRLRLDGAPQRAQVLLMAGRTGEEASQWEIFIDPYSGRVLGARQPGVFRLDRRHVIPFLYHFHHTLHAGKAGTWLMGIVALVWLFDHFLVIYLSFPSLKTWHKSFRLRWRAGGHRLNFDLHRAGGLYAWIVLFTVSLSGLSFNLREPFKAAVAWVSPLTPAYGDVAPRPAVPLENPPLGFEDAIRIATAVRPGRTPDDVSFAPDLGLYRVRLRGEDDIADYGQTKVYVDAQTGVARHIDERAGRTGGDRFLDWQFPLHSGRAFGLAGRMMICGSGLVLSVLVVTGMVIWWKKCKARQCRREGEK